MLANVQKMREEGNLPSVVQDGQLTPHRDAASIELKRLLGSELYEDIEGESGEPTDRYTECSKGEALLAVSKAVWTLNIETSGTGIVRTKGWDESRSDLLSWNEVEQLSEHFRSEAMKLIQPHIPVAEEDTEEAKSVSAGSMQMTVV